MTFTPTSVAWPGKRAVLFVHGIGNASAAGIAAFPVAEFKAAMGAAADDLAIYTLNYDFINDWAASKTKVAAGIAALKNALKIRFGGDALADTIAEYGGDIIWPVLSADIRFAIRDAFVAQLAQMHLDCGEAALARGDDPLDYGLSIIAHSLGCFHTYEVLWAIATDPQYRLRPIDDHFRLEAAVLMASPVQLIRTVGGAIGALVPAQNTLATLANPLALPAQTAGAKTVKVAKTFVSITGTQDPVGGYLLGQRQAWGYMDLAGQKAVINPETLVTGDPRAALTAALTGHGAAGATVQVENPHDWSAYVTRNGGVLQQVLA